jgi:hypothetical protein
MRYQKFLVSVVIAIVIVKFLFAVKEIGSWSE